MPQPVIKSVIIEDDSRALVALNELIEKNFNQSIEVLGNAATIKNGIELIDKVKPNLVFLDIQLADGEAFEILDGINFKSFEVIFATGSADYREKAMDYFAFYYLKKPIDETQFKVVVNKYLEKKSSFNLENYLAFKKQVESNFQKISLPVKNGFEIVPLDEIIFCEAEGSYTNFFTKNKKYVTSSNLKKVENLLQHAHFFRIHRSVLVNLKHITKYDHSGKIILSNKKELFVASRNKSNFLRIIKLMSFTLS